MPRASQVRLLPVAESDLADAVAFVAVDSPEAARRLADRFEAALARLGPNPLIGCVPKDARLVGLGYRVVIVEDYLNFYVARPPGVLVHRIVHGARDLREIL